ncbi:spinocerebellar ataxia type 10 protein domain-containing protein [Radiomyces spectabilis]|uniref:spinocerebellar ataxia type 10 protein domain-containing protein n=1 Tax=Radiomyces spectabilis TaxID=64574 RepID=UPI0022210F8A|nr:spinocerebellar ataxia type 10 protein domain-containing protein [Radiomyces spectabilis]KAI8388624.1 spinocerebellar ataxia type 10 protein domain-containing protein [Radiomyces spectabilis]
MLTIQNFSDTLLHHPHPQNIQEAVNRTIADSAFRKDLGSSLSFWKAVQIVLPQWKMDSTKQECLIGLLKLIRNAVAHEPTNQQLAVDHGALSEIDNIMYTHADGQHATLLQISLQAVCNILTGNDAIIETKWTEWMHQSQYESWWNHVLTLNSDAVVLTAFILILNCIRGNAGRGRVLVQCTNGHALLTAMLDDMERLHVSEGQHFEIGYAIVSQLIAEGHFLTLFNAMQTNEEINSRQTILLKLLDSKLHMHKGTFPEFIGHEEAALFSHVFGNLAKTAMAIMKQVKESHADKKSDLDMDRVGTIYTSLVLVLQILNHLITWEDEQPRLQFTDVLVGDDALTVATDLLRHCEGINLPSSQDAKDSQIGFDYLKRESVRLLGSLCYGNRAMQDKLRQIGGIPLILSQCKIDDSNPYVREYAVVALRHLLEGNLENQKLIEELKPMEAVQTPELDEMGLKATLVDGKVQLSKKH